MKSLARFAVRHRWYVLIIWILLFVGISAVSSSVGSAYKNNFSLPNTNSILATKLLQSGFKAKSGDVDQIVFHATSGTLETDRAAINTMLGKVAMLPEVAGVVSPFCDTVGTMCPGAFQMNKSGTIAYATVNFTKYAQALDIPKIKAVQTTAEKLLRSSSKLFLVVRHLVNSILLRAAPESLAVSSQQRLFFCSPSVLSSRCCSHLALLSLHL